MAFSRGNLGRLLSVAVLALVATGCATDEQKPHRVENMQQAGAVHIAPISIARWDDYVDAMQPHFDISESSALLMAAPITTSTNDAIIDALKLGAQVGLPQSLQTMSRTESAIGDTTSKTSSTTSEEKPGVLPTASTQPVATQTDATKLPGQVQATAPTKSDPTLTYAAAAAIYQEVQILNRYLSDAALRYDYVPYVVRVQISLEPFARRQPYDAYVALGVFSRRHRDMMPATSGNESGTPPGPVKAEDLSDGSDKQVSGPIDVKGIPLVTGTSLNCREVLPAYVIPLLVTDNVEGAQAARSVDVARQLAFSLGGVIHSVALQADMQRLLDRFSSILGTDVNSLMTVSRNADNVLDVRLGAALQPSSHYAMIPRNHSLTFVVLVRRQHVADDKQSCLMKGEVPLLSMSSVSEFRDAESGEALPTDREEIRQRAERVLRRNLPPDTSPEVLRNINASTLINDVQTQDIDDFENQLEAHKDFYNPKWPESLWTGLSTVIASSDYATASMELPQAKTPVWEDVTKQLVVLSDNQNAGASATIYGLTNFVAARYVARLELGASKEITLAASSVTQAKADAPVVVTFPATKSIRDLTVGGVKFPPTPDQIMPNTKLILKEKDVDPWRREALSSHEFERILYKSGAKAGDFALQAHIAVDTLTAANDGQGNLRIFVDKLGKDVEAAIVSFANATLGKVTPDPTDAASAKGGAIRVTKAGTLDVQLGGLVAGRAVRVEITGEAQKGSVEPSSFTISVTQASAK